MSTSCNTHDYDGELREKWLSMRLILIKEYFSKCLSFEETLKDIEEWFNKKYSENDRIKDAKRSLDILSTERRSNFDSANDIHVEELLPILWYKIKNQDDLHDAFYEQLCDITNGSCSQGRSTRFFQFLFLFDQIPSSTAVVEAEKNNTSTEQKSTNDQEIKSDNASSPSTGKDEEQQTRKEQKSIPDPIKSSNTHNEKLQ